ncbi:MAG: hypothetical protein AAF497_17835, partial [Planctomycetota bacterium]
DGRAVGSHTGNYNSSSLSLILGADVEQDPDNVGLTQDPNLQDPPTFFTGIIDEVQMFVFDDGTTFGAFDYIEDNGYFTDVFLPSQSGYGFTLDSSSGGNAQSWTEGDVDFDGDFDQDDVNIFVSNWLSQSDDLPGDGPAVGDYTTLAMGDLTLDGNVNLDDWFEFHRINRETGANLSIPVPEPQSHFVFLLLFAAANLRGRRRQRR